MKKIISSGIFVFFIIYAFSQSCAPNGVIFSSENDIYGFRYTFPDCTEIEGDVEIRGSNINSLSSLSFLTRIWGDLTITNCSSLTSLSGLHNIDSIGGRLEIHNVNNISNLSGLSGLQFVDKIGIASNLNLSSLSGLDNITSVRELVIFVNSDLEDLNGLNNLESVSEWLVIYDNSSLQDFSGLEKLGHVGNLTILSNINLQSISGFESLSIVDGKLSIKKNYKLHSLSGLDKLNGHAIDSIFIYENPLLSKCHIESICEYFEGEDVYAEIYGNAHGCNSPEEVQDSCEATAGYPDMNLSNDDIFIYPNPASKNVNISIEGLTIDDIMIYTPTGQQVFAIRPEKEAIEISSLKSGMYIVEVTVENRKIRKKLLVK